MKHAYLIIANDNFEQLTVLVSMLDDQRNDIYIHIDKKWKGINESDLKKVARYSQVVILEDPIDVRWGHYSQIECELKILKAAYKKGEYLYYHLLSGKDLPIKSQDYIHDFFEKNRGKEFIRFEKETMSHEYRYAYFYDFLEDIDRPKNKIDKIKIYLTARTQKILGVDRRRKNSTIQFQKGANWFSITENLVEYVIEKQEWIYDTFHSSYCCDEVFLQTIVNNSPFKERLYHKKYDNDCHAIMRYIDWERGNPYVFRNSDYDELMNSDLLFARKFDINVDGEIIARIKQAVGGA